MLPMRRMFRIILILVRTAQDLFVLFAEVLPAELVSLLGGVFLDAEGLLVWDSLTWRTMFRTGGILA